MRPVKQKPGGPYRAVGPKKKKNVQGSEATHARDAQINIPGSFLKPGRVADPEVFPENPL